MAVFFWYILSNVTCLVYASVHTYTGHFLYFLQGTRKTRSCLTGHPVPLGGGDIATTSSKLIESSAEFSSCNRLKSNLKGDYFRLKSNLKWILSSKIELKGDHFRLKSNPKVDFFFVQNRTLKFIFLNCPERSIKIWIYYFFNTILWIRLKSNLKMDFKKYQNMNMILHRKWFISVRIDSFCQLLKK